MIRLTKNHIQPAIETLASAFENYPVKNFLIPDDINQKKKTYSMNLRANPF